MRALSMFNFRLIQDGPYVDIANFYYISGSFKIQMSMKKFLFIAIALTLSAFTSAYAQDDDVWRYEAVYVRYGKGPDGIKSTKDDTKWELWQECKLSVTIDLDKKEFEVKKGSDIIHHIPFAVLNINTDSNPANVLMSGMDYTSLDLAAIDWFLYKGAQHEVYLFYDSGFAIEFLMKRL